MKDQTRVDGPWTEKDEVRVPSDRLIHAGILEKPHPWQAELKERLERKEFRKVNMVIDPRGCKGKSTFVEWLEYLGLTVEMPDFNSCEELLAACMDMEPMKIYLFDLNRAMAKKHLIGIYGACEKLKNGVMYDKRYHFKRRRLEYTPNVCIFSNCEPELKYLSRDRWNLWTITKDKRLITYACDHKKPKNAHVQEEEDSEGTSSEASEDVDGEVLRQEESGEDSEADSEEGSDEEH